jgi:hypothetical protein
VVTLIDIVDLSLSAAKPLRLLAGRRNDVLAKLAGPQGSGQLMTLHGEQPTMLFGFQLPGGGGGGSTPGAPLITWTFCFTTTAGVGAEYAGATAATGATASTGATGAEYTGATGAEYTGL